MRALVYNKTKENTEILIASFEVHNHIFYAISYNFYILPDLTSNRLSSEPTTTAAAIANKCRRQPQAVRWTEILQMEYSYTNALHQIRLLSNGWYCHFHFDPSREKNITSNNLLSHSPMEWSELRCIKWRMSVCLPIGENKREIENAIIKYIIIRIEHHIAIDWWQLIYIFFGIINCNKKWNRSWPLNRCRGTGHCRTVLIEWHMGVMNDFFFSAAVVFVSCRFLFFLFGGSAQQNTNHYCTVFGV